MSHSDDPLLMIPGPVEVSPAVRSSYSVSPPGHLSSAVSAAFSRSLVAMRRVWKAGDDAQPFILAGSGTAAMDMAVANLVDAGQRVVVVETGYFSRRIAEMARRRGASVDVVAAPAGRRPAVEEVTAALDRGPTRALLVTHVDTSTGVRVDPEPLLAAAREREVLSIVDGVCATAGEVFHMADWGADVYLTAAQKALSLPPGLGLMVVSARALAARETLATKPPMFLDWLEWLPIHRAYEEGRAAYFATPATNLLLALVAGLREIEADGVEARWQAHQAAAHGLRAAWAELGLELLPTAAEAAWTLSTLLLPDGVAAGDLLPRIAAHGAVVAGGLHPDVRERTFRVGHMGYSVTRHDFLERTVEAVALGLADVGRGATAEPALRALRRAVKDAAATA